MTLADTKEVHDLAVEIIQNFDFRGGLMEEHLGTSGKWLDVGFVRRDLRNDQSSKSVLPADVGEWTDHCCGSLMVKSRSV